MNFRFCLFFLAASLGGVGTLAQAQTGDELLAQRRAMDSVGQALDRTITKAKKVTGNAAFKKQFGTYGFFEAGCVFGVRLRPGKSASESFQLNAGQSYVLIGGGDNAARDVDVYLTDSKNRVVGKDTEADASPFVLFKPKSTGRYRMWLRLKASQGGTSSFCSMVVLRKGGYNLPLERITQAVAKAAVASALLFKSVNGGRFNQDGDTWALYGAVLKPRQSVASDAKTYRSLNRGFVGVGDNSVKDLDLFLLAGGTNKRVASDTKSEGAAMLLYPTSRKSYSIALQNNYSTGPALVMAVLVDLPASLRLPPNGLSASDINARSGQSANTGSAAPSKGVSPFAGRWSGDWQDDANMQEGQFEMNVASNGSLTGRVYNATVNVASAVRGTLSADGTLRFSYSYAGVNYFAQGKLGFDEVDDLTGRVTFSANGQPFGAALFVLSSE